MTRVTFFTIPAMIAISCTVNAAGIPEGKGVTWICGTKIVGGAFYSESGSVRCDDGPGAEKKEIASNSNQVFCMYNAVCTPVTSEVRKVVKAAYNEHALKKVNDFSEISDDHVAQTLTNAVMAGVIPQPLETPDYSVQCIGDKVDGKPNCPSLNDCVNNRKMSSQFWKVQPLNQKMIPLVTDSQGAMVRKNGPDAPRGLGTGNAGGVIK